MADSIVWMRKDLYVHCFCVHLGLLKSFFLQQPFLFDTGCSVYLILLGNLSESNLKDEDEL